MQYLSTRGERDFGSSAAIVRGIAPDGGLFVPESIPPVTTSMRIELAGKPYAQRAAWVLGQFLSDFSADEIQDCVQRAYGDRFDDDAIAPLRPVAEGLYALELWHGPTAAFKDMALQILPYLFTLAKKKEGRGETTLILTATSGDTGKAALEGFRDVDGIQVLVFYPYGGVSEMQRLQMVTQQGSNVRVVAVRGNFDDAQRGVKQIFNDLDSCCALAEKGIALSSANSINWGRLVPQIAYYLSAWCDLYASGDVKEDELVDFVVPTGNFGNILAGWYAKQMGVPIGSLICASNRNRVLADFLEDGHYDTRRSFFSTLSPSMDILVSSNLERLLFEVSGRDSAMVKAWMKSLSEEGRYQISEDVRSVLGRDIHGGWADDEATAKAIASCWREHGYCLDPHTAVGYHVYRSLPPSGRKTVLVSTASPFKFCMDVLPALTQEPVSGSLFEECQHLAALTGWKVPEGIDALRTLPVLHCQVTEREDMAHVVLEAGDTFLSGKEDL